MCVPKVQRSTLIEGNADPCRARYRIPRVYVADPHGGDEGVDGLAQVERITKRPKQHDWVARHDSGNARRDTVEARTGRGLAGPAQFIAPDLELVWAGWDKDLKIGDKERPAGSAVEELVAR